MPDGDRRQRVISSTPRLSPEDVGNRTFATKVRGVSEAEVRTFLRRVSEEMVAMREREEQLVATLDELEERLRAPRPLDEQELLDALGEETARLLRSAREAADDIRKRAEERAARVMEDAQTEAHRLRTDAAEILGVRTQEAEEHVADVIAEGEARAAELREGVERAAEEQRLRAETEAEGLVESARQQGREMLDEARSARERVLADLGRRRALLQAQVEELRQGRDRLLDAYRVVKRTFLDATEALAQVEARAAAERPLHLVDVAVDDAQVAEAEIPGPAAPPPPEGIAVDIAAEDTKVASGDEPHTLADVDSLFARIRAGNEEVASGPAETEPVAPEPVAPEPAAAEAGVEAEAESSVEAEPSVEAEAETGAGQEIALTETAAETGGAPAWRAMHAAGVESLSTPLLKRSKRTAQDDQNALLDAVRRFKGRPTAVQVLRDADALTAAWSNVLRASIDEAYGAGRVAAGGEAAGAPDELLREVAEAIALPLRERLAAAIDDVEGTDTSGLVERIGARYREWKNQQLDRVLGDVVVVAWSRGVYDTTPDTGVLQWIPLVEGHCSDCDDNALEPTVKGEAFPTGQPHPPAHPGCRCLLAPVDVLAAVSGLRTRT